MLRDLLRVFTYLISNNLLDMQSRITELGSFARRSLESEETSEGPAIRCGQNLVKCCEEALLIECPVGRGK